MSKELYLSVSGLTKRTSNWYFSQAGLSKKVLRAYCSVSGLSKLFYDSNGWRKEADIPYNFYQGSAVVFRGKVHLLGGVDNPTMHISWDGTNWTQESTLPYNFILGSAVVWNNKIYILGSSSALGAHYSWDGSSWTQEASVPVNFYGENNAVIYDGYIHVISSWWGSYGNHRYVCKYDGTAWTSVINPSNNSYASSASYDGKIYLLGASGTGGAGYQEYEDGVFGDVKSIPYQFSGGFALVYNGKIHMLGSGARNQDRVHESFDGTDFVSISKMPYSFFYCPAVVYRGRIHIFGGNANRTEHWSYGEGRGTIYSNLYPNATIYNAGTVAVTNGRRSPVTKRNDGDSIVFISKNATTWDNKWIYTCCIALTYDEAVLDAPNEGLNVSTHVINGTTYYFSLHTGHPTYDGATTVSSPVSVPIFDELFICNPNSSPTTARVAELIELLGIEVKS